MPAQTGNPRLSGIVTAEIVGGGQAVARTGTHWPIGPFRGRDRPQNRSDTTNDPACAVVEAE